MRQCVGKKLLVCGAFVDIDALAFATVAAHTEIFALLALVLNRHTFFDKIDCNRVLGQSKKVRVVYVAHCVAIQTIEITRIDFSVAFDDELVTAMPFHSALFRELEMRKTHEIVKLTYGSILAVHTVFEI